MILDIILGLIILASAVYGYKRGFIKSIWGIAAWGITIAAVYAAMNPAIALLNGTKTAVNINNSIYTAVADKLTADNNLSLSQATGLPEWAVKGISLNDVIDNSVEITAHTAADTLILINVCFLMLIK